MAQFDVYANPSKATRHAYPFLLDIQSDVVSEVSTRIVLPLGKLDLMHNQSMKRLTPVVEYGDEQLLILTLQISSVPARVLKSPIGSLSHLRDEIIAALDFAVTGS